jgi:hypothetical protein
VAFAGPILPGKEEPWRRFLQELSGSRTEEYEEFKWRLGILAERVWLMRTPDGETAIGYFEVYDPQEALARLAASERPFDSWLREKLREFHGCDITRLRSGWHPELVFASTGPEEVGPPDRKPSGGRRR